MKFTKTFFLLQMAAEGLFYEYDQMPNWRGAPEIFAYLEDIANKEVPAAASKNINETFTPEIKYQHLFAAPVLPQAITDRLTSAPKGVSKVPKVVNDILIRAVCIFNIHIPSLALPKIAFLMFFFFISLSNVSWWLHISRLLSS